MRFVVTIAGVTGFYFVMADFWGRLPPEKGPAFRRWFHHWTIKGLLVPFALWMLFNSAVFDAIPPLMLEVEAAKLNGQWFDALEFSAALGLFVIGSYWAALTTAWLLMVLFQCAEDPPRFRGLVVMLSAALLPLAILMVAFLGWRCLGLALVVWLLPIAQQVLAIPAERKLPPMYSRAMAALAFDRHQDAEAFVLAELEKCENDFDGWMLLAELYANYFDDLAGAENLIRDTCAAPSIPPSQFAVAFHKLADWQLKIGRDPAAARQSLGEICRRYPKSHLDKMARLRLGQIPATPQQLAAQSTAQPIPLRHLRQELDQPAPEQSLNRTQASSQAREEIARLEKDPDDIPARERLARLFAEQMGKVQLGLEQLELLLGIPDPPPGKPAEWLALMAAWQLRYQQDQPAARQLLERLIRLYPDSIQAFSAHRRLAAMDIEARLRGGGK